MPVLVYCGGLLLRFIGCFPLLDWIWGWFYCSLCSNDVYCAVMMFIVQCALPNVHWPIYRAQHCLWNNSTHCSVNLNVQCAFFLHHAVSFLESKNIVELYDLYQSSVKWRVPNGWMPSFGFSTGRVCYHHGYPRFTRVWLPSILPMIWEPSRTSCVKLCPYPFVWCLRPSGSNLGTLWSRVTISAVPKCIVILTPIHQKSPPNQ